MSIFWKQSLWLGGVYWVISQVFSLINTYEADLVDFALSVLLTLFLVPMCFMVPVKAIDKAIKKMPVTATFLVSVGWVPYFVVLVFVVSIIVAITAIVSGAISEDHMIYYLVNVLPVVVVVRQMMTLLLVLVALFAVLVHHKSIAGCLDKRYNLIEDDSCNLPVVEPAVVSATKKAQKCKTEKAKESKKTVVKKVAAKKAVVKKDERKETVKKAKVKKPTKKTEAKTSKKKKTADNKE